MPLILPKTVTVTLRLPDRTSLPLANVLLSIQTFAARKNDISMFPFATGADGVAQITRDMMLAQVAATYDSGLMDYASIESAYDMVEIRISSVTEIERAAEARTKTWNSLLNGERERWKTIDDLISCLRHSANRELDIPDALSIRPRVRDSWTDAEADKSYDIYVRRRKG